MDPIYRHNVSPTFDERYELRTNYSCILGLSPRQVKKILKGIRNEKELRIVSKKSPLYREQAIITPSFFRRATTMDSEVLMTSQGVAINIVRKIDLTAFFQDIREFFVSLHQQHRIGEQTLTQALEELHKIMFSFKELQELGFFKFEIKRKAKHYYSYLNYIATGPAISNPSTLFSALRGCHFRLDAIMENAMSQVVRKIKEAIGHNQYEPRYSDS